MAEFVPKDKMSKKAQKEMNRQQRKTWEFSPVTRIADSKKRYNRKKKAHDRYEDYGMGDFFLSLCGFSWKADRQIISCGTEGKTIK